MSMILDQEAPRARLALLLEHFSQIEDDREPWRVMYPMSEVLLLLTCATIASPSRTATRARSSASFSNSSRWSRP